jgi:hypothetical protein
MTTPFERIRHLKDALRELADSSEDFAGSEPDMPGHPRTEERFEEALSKARVLLDGPGEERP